VILNKEVDDQVLLKSDGFPTYHLANVVDDHLMKISHVIRAEEWITSVPKHILLYKAFNWPVPVMIHMPLLRNKDRSKISKRKNPVSLHWYRAQGFLPEAMINFLAKQGWSLDGEHDKFSREEMLEAFDITRVSISGPVFDLEKLDWLNGMYIRECSPKRLRKLLEEYMPSERKMSEEQIQKLLPLVQERLKRLCQWDELTSYFHPGPLSFDAEFLRIRKKNKADGRELHPPFEVASVLKEILEKAKKLELWQENQLESLVKEVFETLSGWKIPELFMFLRKATTGRMDTPPVFETLEIIGQKNCLERWEVALKKLELMQELAQEI
jgi:glutamyl-tRNA synthetase